MYDLYPTLVEWDYFIKELYAALSAKLKVTSEMVVDMADRAEVKEDKSTAPEKPLESDGPPLLIADIPDESDPKTLPSDNMRTCNACGTEVPQESSVCPKCNAPLSRVCRACGAAPPSWAQFCNSCGAKL